MHTETMTDPPGTHGLWADLHRSDVSPEEADFTVIGIPYDEAASARRGARLAPQRIRYWSRHTTPFSENRTRLKGIRICDLGDMEVARPGPRFPVHPAQGRVPARTSPSSLAAIIRSRSRSSRASSIDSGTRRSAFCGWTRIRICAMSTRARSSRTPASCGAGSKRAFGPRTSAWSDCVRGRSRRSSSSKAAA